METRAYYNALRTSYCNDPSAAEEIEDWKLYDYRRIPLNLLFEALSEFELYFDKSSFLTYAEECDTPEELTDNFIGNADIGEEAIDRIYLIIFELWRRLLPEKRCLSIFCDEIDYQIFTYNTKTIDNPEHLETAIANLKQVLEDNADLGEEPKELFSTIAENCAHDLEGFLYNFVSEQIDHGNSTYAAELIEDFSDVVQDTKWFTFLQARLIADNDPAETRQLIAPLIKKTATDTDIDFNFEMLSFLVQEGDQKQFIAIVKNILPLLETEQDFQDLLVLCSDYFQFLDQDEAEKKVQNILQQRKKNPLEDSFSSSDSDLKELKKVLKQSS